MRLGRDTVYCFQSLEAFSEPDKEGGMGRADDHLITWLEG